jgi:hypothetical protein
MINCLFLPVFYEYHLCIKEGKPTPGFNDFNSIEDIWLGFYGMGKFETYQFLYSECKSITHLQEWMINLKGEKNIRDSAAAFAHWRDQKALVKDETGKLSLSLTEAQWQHWRQQGYIKVSGLVSEPLCDAVCELICNRLGADLSLPQTWYNNHPDWHGLMLQLYQHESIHAIKMLPAISHLFAELYGTTSLIANTEKVSFNPPETADWKFRHNQLHWDIDFDKADLFYIQGLVYLNDVPENRGPLTVVPGFHHQFEDWIKAYPNAGEAQLGMQNAFTGTPVPGNKGDVVLWMQTLPHAASANHSHLPRFVQYVSFSKL